MPALPWTWFGTPAHDHEYVVMASTLPLQQHRHIPAFLRATLAIRQQLATADGLLGYALDAKLMRRTFWTLSVWDGPAALAAFAGADPHAGRVAAIRPHMGRSTFVTWAVRPDDLPVTWADARRRVSEAQAQ